LVWYRRAAYGRRDVAFVSDALRTTVTEPAFVSALLLDARRKSGSSPDAQLGSPRMKEHDGHDHPPPFQEQSAASNSRIE
jgi:hypothetical protein